MIKFSFLFIGGVISMVKNSAIISLVVVSLFTGCATQEEPEVENEFLRFQVTFKNTTDEPLELYINGGKGEGFKGFGYRGTIPPSGQIITQLEVDKVALGTQQVYSYTAGEHIGNFSVWEGMNPIFAEVIPEGTDESELPYRHPQGKDQVGVIPVKVNN